MTQAGRDTTPTAITIADLNTEIDSEPRVLDVVLGERLAFVRSRDVRKIIERNESELRTYGALPTRQAARSILGGRPGTAYYLNEPQALLICMFSNTAMAAEVRRQLITVFMEYRRSQQKPIQVREHERRPSTKLDNAISLARSAERLEKIAETLQPRQQVLSATIIDGQPVVFDAHDTDYKEGDAVLGFDWYGKLIVQTVKAADIDRSWRPGGIRLQHGPTRLKNGLKTSSAFFCIGKVVVPDVPTPPTPVAPALPVPSNDNRERLAERKGPYQDQIIRMIGQGKGNAEIARRVGCSKEAAIYWRRKLAA